MVILKFLGAVAGMLLLLMVGALGWYIVQANKHNSAALANAQEVCSQVGVGESIQALRATAEQLGGRYLNNGEDVHAVAFSGYIYDHAECRRIVADNIVMSKEGLMVHE